MYQQLKAFRLPGSVWTLLFVAVTALIHMYAPNPVIYDAVLVLGGWAAKAVDVRFDKVIEIVEIITKEPVAPVAMARGGQQQSIEVMDNVNESAGSQALRWLVGG